MLSLRMAETALAVGVVLCFLGCDVVAWWMMVSGEVEAYRRGYREWMMGKRLEEIGEQVGEVAHGPDS